MLHWVKEEIRALVVCALLLLVGVVFVFIFWGDNKQKEVVTISEADRQIMNDLAQQMLDDSMRYARQKNLRKDSVALFPFDPNHADSATLLDLGFRPWQISNMLKYRRKGGRWHSAEDFKRLYGLTAEDFTRIRPYIRIAPADRSKKEFYEERQKIYQQRAESLHYHLVKKLPEGETLELSGVDTTALKQIPGIGSYYAGKIVRYRERLGGFVSLEQLNEVDGLPENITTWFTLDSTSVVRQIHLNHATFKQLVRHPYLSYEQTKVIVNHIRKFGPISSWQDLNLYKEFTEDDFMRLSPYISFDE